jgi:ABC-type antimicrobial peptide transport system permease subunit
VTARALRYGLLAARRRARALVLPAVTVATGAFLLVLVTALMPAIRRQGETFGNAAGIGRAAVVMSVIVLVVGALEVAIAATRSVAQRAREIGVLSTFGVPAGPIVCGLMVEPVATAAAGGIAGALLGAALPVAGSAAGWAGVSAAPAVLVPAAAVAVATSVLAAALAATVPSLRAARRPPLSSLAG